MDEDCPLTSAESGDHFLSRDLQFNFTQYFVAQDAENPPVNSTLLRFLHFAGGSNATPHRGPPEAHGGDTDPTGQEAFYLDDKHMPQFTELSLIKTVVLSVMFFIALVGNFATLLRMYQMRKRQSTINLLIMHLATADLIVTFFCNVTDAVWSSTIQWYAGNVACKLVKFLQVFGLYSSTYVIVIISVDRCLAILDPISKNRAPGRVKIMIIVAWVLSALFSIPQTYIFRVEKAPFRRAFYQCVTYGAYSAQWQEQLYSTLSLLLMFVIPLATMIVAYTLIFYTIARKSRDFQHDCKGAVETLSRGPVRSQLLCRAKVKSLRMTAVIVLAFIVCWTPYQVMFIIYTFVGETNIDNRYVMWIFFCGMANSMVNPLIYGAFHVCRKSKKVRKTLEPRQMRLRTPPHSSSPSSTSKVLRHYLSKLRVPLAAAKANGGNTSYPMAMLIRNHHEAGEAISSQF